MAPIYYALVTLKSKLETDREKGATAVEYALIIALLSVVVIAALVLLVPPIQGVIAEVIADIG